MPSRMRAGINSPLANKPRPYKTIPAHGLFIFGLMRKPTKSVTAGILGSPARTQ